MDNNWDNSSVISFQKMRSIQRILNMDETNGQHADDDDDAMSFIYETTVNV